MNKLSQIQFADSLKVSPTLISKIEHDKALVTDRILQQITSTYNVSTEWLLCNTDNMLPVSNNAITCTSIELQQTLIKSQLQYMLETGTSLDNWRQDSYFSLLKELIYVVVETTLMFKDATMNAKTMEESQDLVDSFSQKYRKIVEQHLDSVK
jgi:transcriptional regulator with XRE-family HTH domain